MTDYIDLKQGQTREFWYLLSYVERSWVIYKAYNEHILKKEEVSALLWKDRLNTVFTHALPLALFPAAYWALPQVYTPAARIWRKSSVAAVAGLAVFPVFAWWRATNPFRVGLTAERERLLGVINERVGNGYLLNLNEMLPRWMTEFEAHRRLRVLRGRKNGIFAGIIYPPEERLHARTGIFAFEKSNYQKIVQA